MDYKKELQELSSCCGTTCDSKGNLKYVRGLLEYIIQLEEKLRDYEVAKTKGQGRTSAKGADAKVAEPHLSDMSDDNRTG